ncbi:fluoride efflux transporter CrcB [Pseudonocardia sp. GCM10023141]|uniref:fluoride efflux transporter CrcB n=1 Tax=Pseudonocardia sp. GCM10023141 TaxID=3252653 RepID=UPI00361D0847
MPQPPPTGHVVAAVSIGGAAGATARWAVGLAVPHSPGGFPLGTFLINIVGCVLLGALVATVTERPRTHPLWRPLLGTGVLGGFTTFSTYAVDAHELVRAGAAGTAAAYVAGTLVAALLAAWLGILIARTVLGGAR